MLAALGRYKILGRIGSGRMGELFRARDTRAGRTVAIRIVADDIAGHPQRRLRFVSDARKAGALSHPNVAALYEVDEDQGRLFLVSEYVPGDLLTTVIADRALNPRHALDHAVQLADALADAHAAGVVHGDIRPAAIIITPKGIAKFVDVGLAAWTDGGFHRSNMAGILARGDRVSPVTVAHMPPEQLLGKPPDEPGDIFSLGAVVFEMLTGRRPFGGADAAAVTEEILKAVPPIPSGFNRALPADLDPIVLKMLAKSPDERYESAATLAAELRSVAAMLDTRDDRTESIASVRRAPAGRVRSGVWVALAVIVVAMLLLLATGSSEPGVRTLARAWHSLVG